MHPPLHRRLGRTLALAAALLIVPLGSPANAATAAAGVSRARTWARPRSQAGTAAGTTAKSAADVKPDAVSVCPPAAKGSFTCFALKRTDLATHLGLVRDAVAPDGFGPADLLSAYNLPAAGGAGATVAIVDAYDDPNAEADLALYRQPVRAAGLRVGRRVLPQGRPDRRDQLPGGERRLVRGDLAGPGHGQRHSAQGAHHPGGGRLDLVRPTSAAAWWRPCPLGAGYVSNSYGTGYSSDPGSGEDPSEVTQLDAYYNHPGVAVVASSGDDDYGVSYPAASQYVTSVGGTALVKDTSARGWSESVWNNSYGGPGSGCSLYEPKPSFQTDSGCAQRTVADVSAVADPVTGVAVYDSYQASGWQVYGGTSVSSPLIAGVYADAGTPSPGTYPNSYPYARRRVVQRRDAGFERLVHPGLLVHRRAPATTARRAWARPTAWPASPAGRTAPSTAP